MHKNRKISLGNDFIFLWQIKRGGNTENLLDAINLKLIRYIGIFGQKGEEIPCYPMSDGILKIEITPNIAPFPGKYFFELRYELPDLNLSDEDRKCRVDIDAFTIVPRTSQEGNLYDITVTSEMLVALSGTRLKFEDLTETEIQTIASFVSGEFLEIKTVGEGNAVTSISKDGKTLTFNKDIIFSTNNHNHDSLYKSIDYNPNWNDIANIPNTFTPSEHGHTIRDIENLQTELGKKATEENLNTHIEDKNNPHKVEHSQLENKNLEENFQHITLEEKSSLNNHISNFENPHNITIPQIEGLISQNLGLGENYLNTESDSLNILGTESRYFSIAIGQFSKAVDIGLAVGSSSEAKNFGTSIGNTSSSDRSISIGRFSNSNNFSISIGEDSFSDNYSIAIGRNALVFGNTSVAIGEGTIVEEDNTGILGGNENYQTNKWIIPGKLSVEGEFKTPKLDNHLIENNPHKITHISLEDKNSDENYLHISQTEKNVFTDKYTKEESNSNFEPKDENIQAHISTVEGNPHAVTKGEVGLGNVDNIKQATKAEFDDHVNNEDMARQHVDMEYSSLTGHFSGIIVHSGNRVYKSSFFQNGISGISIGGSITGDRASGNIAIGGKVKEIFSFSELSNAIAIGYGAVANRSNDAVLGNTDHNWRVPGTMIVQKGFTAPELTDHINNTDNPHEVTKAQVGLGNVNNTSDADKPISDATNIKLNLKANTIDVDEYIETLNLEIAALKETINTILNIPKIIFNATSNKSSRKINITWTSKLDNISTGIGLLHLSVNNKEIETFFISQGNVEIDLNKYYLYNTEINNIRFSIDNNKGNSKLFEYQIQ